MTDITPGWKMVGIVPEPMRVSIDGLDPWELEWHSVAEQPITVAHPQYPAQRHLMWVYELRAKGKVVKFAAGEFSANVWGFYVEG
jgi:hypothetical protein